MTLQEKNTNIDFNALVSRNKINEDKSQNISDVPVNTQHNDNPKIIHDYLNFSTLQNSHEYHHALNILINSLPLQQLLSAYRFNYYFLKFVKFTFKYVLYILMLSSYTFTFMSPISSDLKGLGIILLGIFWMPAFLYNKKLTHLILNLETISKKISLKPIYLLFNFKLKHYHELSYNINLTLRNKESIHLLALLRNYQETNLSNLHSLDLPEIFNLNNFLNAVSTNNHFSLEQQLLSVALYLESLGFNNKNNPSSSNSKQSSQTVLFDTENNDYINITLQNENVHTIQNTNEPNILTNKSSSLIKKINDLNHGESEHHFFKNVKILYKYWSV